MALPWLTALKNIPWESVIEHGPKVLDKARDMVNRHRDAKSPAGETDSPDAGTTTQADPDALNQQLQALQLALTRLSSSNLELTQSVNKLREQQDAIHASLAAIRRRNRWLVAGIICVAGGLACTIWLT